MSEATVPRAAESLSGNPQSMKVRRLQQSLFLTEMEKLADAMCRHYMHTRADVDALGEDGVRRTVDAIHDRVHNTLREEALSSTTMELLNGSARPVVPPRAHAQPGNTSPAGFLLPHPPPPPPVGKLPNSTQPPSSSTPTVLLSHDAHQPTPGGDPRAGAAPPVPRAEWTAEESRGVAMRLRRLAPVSLSGSVGAAGAARRREEHTAFRSARVGLVNEDDATPPVLQVQRFDLNSDHGLLLLDMNMDNNTTCLSARRPVNPHSKLDPATEVHASMTARARAQHLAPAPPAKRFPRDRYFEEAPFAGRRRRSTWARSALLEGHSGGGRQSERWREEGGTQQSTEHSWSPRATLFAAAKRGRQQHSSLFRQS